MCDKCEPVRISKDLEYIIFHYVLYFIIRIKFALEYLHTTIIGLHKVYFETHSYSRFKNLLIVYSIMYAWISCNAWVVRFYWVILPSLYSVVMMMSCAKMWHTSGNMQKLKIDPVYRVIKISHQPGSDMHQVMKCHHYIHSNEI